MYLYLVYEPRLLSTDASMTFATSLLAEAIAANGTLPDNDLLASGSPFCGSSTTEWASLHLRHLTSLTVCYYSHTKIPLF